MPKAASKMENLSPPKMIEEEKSDLDYSPRVSERRSTHFPSKNRKILIHAASKTLNTEDSGNESSPKSMHSKHRSKTSKLKKRLRATSADQGLELDNSGSGVENSEEEKSEGLERRDNDKNSHSTLQTD
jgi:hypothetical protein